MLDSPATLALPATPASPQDEESHGQRLSADNDSPGGRSQDSHSLASHSQDSADSHHHPLVDHARPRDRAPPPGVRDSRRTGPCTGLSTAIVPAAGIGTTIATTIATAGAARGSVACMAMGIQDMARIRTHSSSIQDSSTGAFRASLIMGLVMGPAMGMVMERAPPLKAMRTSLPTRTKTMNRRRRPPAHGNRLQRRGLSTQDQPQHLRHHRCNPSP